MSDSLWWGLSVYLSIPAVESNVQASIENCRSKVSLTQSLRSKVISLLELTGNFKCCNVIGILFMVESSVTLQYSAHRGHSACENLVTI